MSTHAIRRTAVASAVIVALAAAMALPQTAEARDVKAQARGNVNSSVNRSDKRDVNVRRDTNVNKRTDVNVNKRTRIDVDRNVDIDIDVDNDWDHHHHHPIATGVAIGAAAAVTSAVIGSIVYTLPPACSTVVVNGIAYSQCGNVWYQPQYVGTSVQYVVVTPLR
jgi:Ni/Co efflux regulator RcnB